MTNPNRPPDPLTHERAFISRLSRLERGPLAELRRSLSDTPGQQNHWLDGLMLGSGFGKALDSKRIRSAFYLTAGLYALIERPHDDETEEQAAARASREGKSLGHLLGTLYREQGQRPSTEKRFLALLDADEAALPYQLRQAVALLRGSDLKPDWAQLLRDVSGWHAEDWGDDIRRRWAREFYRAALPGQPIIPNDDIDNIDTPDSAPEATA